jgi:GNAT superfamily N-acetyltransferase
MKVRRLTASEARALRRPLQRLLDRLAGELPGFRGAPRERLEGFGGELWAALEGGRPVALALGTLEPPGLYWLDRLYVLPSFRRRGLARRLVRKARAFARRRGCTRLLLSCAAGNAGALALYKGEGFEPCSVETPPPLGGGQEGARA